MKIDASRTRRLRGAERRDLILDGAMQIFAEQGYNDASMVEIARAAGITPAVIYDHFASKQELHEVLLEMQTEALIAFVGSAVISVGDDPADRMRAGIDAFFLFVEEHPFAWRMVFREPPGDPEVEAVYVRLHRRATEAIAVFIGFSAPEPLAVRGNREQVLEMYGQLLKTSLNGLASWWYDHREVSRDEIVDRVMEFCWTGLERLATTPDEEGT